MINYFISYLFPQFNIYFLVIDSLILCDLSDKTFQFLNTYHHLVPKVYHIFVSVLLTLYLIFIEKS